MLVSILTVSGYVGSVVLGLWSLVIGAMAFVKTKGGEYGVGGNNERKIAFALLGSTLFGTAALLAVTIYIQVHY